MTGLTRVGRVVERLSLRAIVGIGEVGDGALLRASATATRAEGDVADAEMLGAVVAHELLANRIPGDTHALRSAGSRLGGDPGRTLPRSPARG